MNIKEYLDDGSAEVDDALDALPWSDSDSHVRTGIALKGPPPSIKDVWSYREMKAWVGKLDNDQLDEPMLFSPGDGTVLAMKRPIIEDEFGVHGERMELQAEDQASVEFSNAWWNNFLKGFPSKKKKKAAKKRKKAVKKKAVKKKRKVAPSVARRKKKKKKAC